MIGKHRKLQPSDYVGPKTKDIVITMEDGIINGVYCPHDEFVYEIHVLDQGNETIDSTTLRQYFEDVETHLGFLQNCY